MSFFSKFALKFIHNLSALDLSIAHQLRAKSTKEAVEFYYKHMMGSQIFGTKQSMLDYELSKCSCEGLYLEFGVALAFFTNYMAKKIKPKVIHGFDSFKGFPEYFNGTSTEEHNYHGKLPTVNDNVKLHPGWFESSIPEFIKNNDEQIAYLNIDCDLYSSTSTVFNYLGNRIQKGTIIHFDEFLNFPDWRNHEFKAWNEFVEENKILFDYIAIGNRGEVSVKITGFQKKKE